MLLAGDILTQPIARSSRGCPIRTSSASIPPLLSSHNAFLELIAVRLRQLPKLELGGVGVPGSPPSVVGTCTSLRWAAAFRLAAKLAAKGADSDRANGLTPKKCCSKLHRRLESTRWVRIRTRRSLDESPPTLCVRRVGRRPLVIEWWRCGRCRSRASSAEVTRSGHPSPEKDGVEGPSRPP